MCVSSPSYQLWHCVQLLSHMTTLSQGSKYPSGARCPLQSFMPYRRISPSDLFSLWGHFVCADLHYLFHKVTDIKKNNRDTTDSEAPAHLPWVKFAAASSVLRAAGTYLLMWDKLLIKTSAISATLVRLCSGSCIWHLESMLYHVLINNHKHRGHSLLLDRQL